ncbi:MAG TPA: choice-of-anchor tandem repeat GloVer-containing protein [Terriglobia bacterium]|nr:choice-of-anchor tandem repeat GloVer-containing protein [Terriglobia bacterium]
MARVALTEKIEIIGQFPGSQPNPNANILYGPDGNIYGIGNPLGSFSSGFVYRFTPAGAYSKLLDLPSFQTSSHGLPLVAGADGNLYGTFPKGGTNNNGYVYQATLTGQYRVLANFPATGLFEPGGLLLAAADGNVYGTTNSNDIFRYDLSAKKLELVYHLNLGEGRCYCQLIEGMDGKLYGVAPTGGYVGAGTVFSLEIGLPKPPPSVTGLYPSSGAAGKQVILWGNYLLGATAVSFNGTPANNFKSTSVQSIATKVPTGATSGPVTITTANGSYTTTQSFTVQ